MTPPPCHICGRRAPHQHADSTGRYCPACWHWKQQHGLPRLPLALPEYSLSSVDVIHHMDALTLLRALPAGSVNCIVTSPPYFGLRDYGVSGQIGLENTPAEFIGKLIAIFREVRRVLTDDGTVWVNLGDSYSANRGYQVPDGKYKNVGNTMGMNANAIGLPPKSLMMIPARFAIAMQEDAWILRSEIVWHKPNVMPESVTDRPTTSHEMIYLFAKNPRYWYDADAIKTPIAHSSEKRYALAKSRTIPDTGESTYKAGQGRVKSRGQNADHLVAFASDNGRNERTVWTIPTQPFRGSHFAVMPQELVKRCILAGCPADGVVLDMFMGSGTVALVAKKYGRHYIGSDLNREYVQMARQRLGKILLPMEDKVITAKDGTAHKQASLFAEIQ